MRNFISKFTLLFCLVFFGQTVFVGDLFGCDVKENTEGECIELCDDNEDGACVLRSCADGEVSISSDDVALCACPEDTHHLGVDEESPENTEQKCVKNSDDDEDEEKDDPPGHDGDTTAAASDEEECRSHYATEWKTDADTAKCDWDQDKFEEIVGKFTEYAKAKYAFYQMISEGKTKSLPAGIQPTIPDYRKGSKALYTGSVITSECSLGDEACLSIDTTYGTDSWKALGDSLASKAIDAAVEFNVEVSGDIGANSSLKKCVRIFGGWDDWFEAQRRDKDEYFTPEALFKNGEGKSKSWEKAFAFVRPRFKNSRDKWKIFFDRHKELKHHIQDICPESDRFVECSFWKDHMMINNPIVGADFVRTSSQIVARKIVREVRVCDAMLYATQFNDEYLEKEEMVSSINPALKCENKGVVTQDYAICTKVLKTYDSYAIIDLGVQQAGNIHQQLSATKNQADLMIDAAEDPMDPTLALKELKGNTSTLGREAIGIGVIESAKGGFLLATAAKYEKELSWPGYIDRCRTALRQNSSFDMNVFGLIMGHDSEHDKCYSSGVCTGLREEEDVGSASYINKVKKFQSLLAFKFLNSSKNLSRYLIRPSIELSSYVLSPAFAKKKGAGAEAGETEAGETQDDFTAIISREMQGEDSPEALFEGALVGAESSFREEIEDRGESSSSIELPIPVQYAGVVLKYDHCAVAAERLGGRDDVLPNEKIKNVAKQLGAQNLAKGLVKLAAGTAYFVQAHQIQNMIDDIDTRMEDLDMGGLYSDVLNIGQCELNPTMPECGGYNMGSTGHGFDSGFGSLDMDGGAASSMGSTNTLRDVAGSVDTTTDADGDPSGDFSGAIDGAPAAGSGIVDGGSSAASVKRKGLGGAGGGGASAPSAGLPGGGGGASAPGGGKGGGRYKKKGGYGYNSGKGLYYKSARRGKKGKKNMAELFKGKKSGKTTNFRNVAGVGDSKTSIWKRLSNGYGKAYKSKKLLEYEIVD
jgi:hypothetical protein